MPDTIYMFFFVFLFCYKNKEGFAYSCTISDKSATISIQSMYFYTLYISILLYNPSISTTFHHHEFQHSSNILNRFQSSVYVNLSSVYDAVKQRRDNVLTETKKGKVRAYGSAAGALDT